jgi:hypothetical protein
MQWINWINMLSWWQWALLGAVPPALIALYFLKLRRQPLEVPSTFLWKRSIEDLSVNSLWQRLRRNLLLLLQLLVVAALMMAVLRPSWQSNRLIGGRYIFLVDTSASMSATDVAPNRLDEAKRRVGELLDEMAGGDKAMLISFSDHARVEQSYTDNVQDLRRALAAIRQTNHSTSLDEALRLAAGLANPGRSATQMSDTQVAEPLPAKLYIFSDGRFPDVRGFSLGNLEPFFVPIGNAESANVGIVGFSTQRNEDKPDQLQAFARLENHGPTEASVSLELRLDGNLIDARQVKIPADGSDSEVFAAGQVESGVLRLSLSPADFLAQDDEAWAVVNPPRRTKVLLITPGNAPLSRALKVPAAQQWSDFSEAKPAILDTQEYRQEAASGSLDLVIYDRCAPKTEMPQANTLFIGSLPPVAGWGAGDAVVQPQIIDTDRAHPIMQSIELGDVDIMEARPLKPPPGSVRLIESNKGPLMAVAAREGFEDAVLGFDLISVEQGAAVSNTTWPIKLSFPVFLSNVLQYFGGNREAAVGANSRPGQSVVLRTDAAGPLVVLTPSHERIEVPRDRQGTYNFTQTDELGVYEAQSGGKAIQRFVVNLFDSRESEIRARAEEKVKIGHVEVAGQSHWEPARRELWRFLLLVALGVLLFEWYIYNRRVYL